jgi:hypothetical protein
MDYEEEQEIFDILKKSKYFIQNAYDEATTKHDNYGDLYMNDELWEIMKRCEKLLERIDKLFASYPGNDENVI